MGQEGGGGAPLNQFALPAHGMKEREGGGGTKSRKSGYPPIRMHSLSTACRRGGGGGTPTKRGKVGHLPSSVRPLLTSCRRGRGGGQPRGGRGAPPEQRAPLTNGIQERDGGYPQPRGGRGGTSQSSCAPRARHAEEGGRRDPQPRQGEGGTPQSGARALHAWPDTIDGRGSPRPAEAPHRKTKREGGGSKGTEDRTGT